MGLEANNWGFLLVFLTLLGQADSGKRRWCIPITQLGKLRTGAWVGWLQYGTEIRWPEDLNS